ncbi:MAG: class II aldolase/adducin family protein [Candidatus Adiutricales bacterium]
MDKAKENIIKFGRAMLDLGFQNTHSGNISLRVGDEFYITKTGSMLGHLEESDVVLPGLYEPLTGLFQASSETGTHRLILQRSAAVNHAHTFSTTLLSFFMEEISPVDLLGRKHLGIVPVVEFEIPIGSKEMDEKIPAILADHPAMVVKTHGPFIRGDSLNQAFYFLNLLEYSSEILLNLKNLAIGYADAEAPGSPELPAYEPPRAGKATRDLELISQFKRTSSDLFRMKISPFHTGSISVADGKEMYYSPCASTPDYMENEIQRVSINEEDQDYFKRLHQAVYNYTSAQSAIFTHTSQAMVEAYKAADRGEASFIPVDAEGGFLYPAIPIVSPADAVRSIVEKASRYKMVVILGLGALAVGHTLGDTSHHSSSLNNICFLKTQLDHMEKSGVVENTDDYLFKKGKDW